MNGNSQADDFPVLEALRARRLIELAAYRVAPAMVATAIIATHTGLFEGAITFVCMFGASVVLHPRRYPLHLMPVASLALRAASPIVGMGAAAAIAAFGGYELDLPGILAAIFAAWLITALGAWIKLGFEADRMVRVGVIGTGEFADGLAAELETNKIRGYNVVGWLSTEPDAKRLAAAGRLPCLGTIEQARDAVTEHGIELLVHGLPSRPEAAQGESRGVSRLYVFEEVAKACLDQPVRMIEASQLYEQLLGHVPLGATNAAWFQYIMHPRYRPGSPLSKRVVDLVVGSLAGLIAAPVLLVAALAVKLDDGGPVFHRQRRVREGGREFDMLKIRTMKVGAENRGEPKWAREEDDRVTRVGHLLRKTHIDELPQILHVLRGEMTLVGPRPERLTLVTSLERRFPYYQRRHLVKPGITGWAQARCGYAGSHIGTAWKLCHDLFYLKHRSTFFDLLIMLETLHAVGVEAQFGLELPDEQFIVGERVDEAAVTG